MHWVNISIRQDTNIVSELSHKCRLVLTYEQV